MRVFDNLSLSLTIAFFYYFSILSYILLYPFGFLRKFYIKDLPPTPEMISPFESNRHFDKLDFWTFGHTVATIFLASVIDNYIFNSITAGLIAWVLMYLYEIFDGFRGEGASPLDITANTLGMVLYFWIVRV